MDHAIGSAQSYEWLISYLPFSRLPSRVHFRLDGGRALYGPLVLSTNLAAPVHLPNNGCLGPNLAIGLRR